MISAAKESFAQRQMLSFGLQRYVLFAI